MADQLSCTCGDVYGGFPRNGEEPTSNQYDSTCPIHGNYKELDRRKPSNQPSKESLERAQKVTNHGKHGKWRDCPCEACRLNKRVALEFDDILKDHEQDCDYIRGFNAGRRELHQQNAALVSAARHFAARVKERNPEWFREEVGSTDFSVADHELRAALASYAPAEEKEKP